MNNSLFRQEALAHQQEPIKGSVLLAVSPRSTWLAIGAFAAAALLLTFAWAGEFTRKAHVQGFLAPNKGLIKVFPRVAGTLIERRVEEGQTVHKGDVLAVVSTERGSLSVRSANAATIELLRQRQASLEDELLAQGRIEQLKIQGLSERVASTRSELRQLERTYRTARERLTASQREAARFATLQRDGYVAATQVQQQKDQVLDQKTRMQTLERDRIALEGQLQALETEKRSAELESGTRRAALQRRIAEVEQELTEHQSNRDVVIVAPTDGTATTILIEPGQQTKPDAPLLSIIPQGANLEAKLLIPSHAIGFVTPRQKTSLRYDAFPYQRFGQYHGVVTSIAKTLLLPGDTVLPTPLSEPAYLVTVALDKQAVEAYGKSFPLQAGMALEGDISLDRRSIMQWIFDPLFSLMKSV